AYGEATRMQVRYPTLAGEARTYYDQSMAEAAGAAKALGVQIDTTPAAAEPGASSPGVAVARKMTERAGVVSVAIDAKWGSRVSAAFQLGYRSMLATETVPYLPPAMQADSLGGLRKLSELAGVSKATLDKYVAALTAKDGKAAIFGSLTFKRDVLAQYE